MRIEVEITTNTIALFFPCVLFICIVLLCLHVNFLMFVLILQLVFVLFSQHINKGGTELSSIMK